MSLRIIAKLDVKPPYVVKPVHFEGLRRVGTPKELAEKYYKQGADEVIYVDIVSSLYQREILYPLINETASGIFIPLGCGGGVKSIDDFSKLFHAGADKVIVNTEVLQNNPHLITEAAETFGSQSVVVNIEAKSWGSWWECYSDCGRMRSGKDVIEWVKEVEQLGAGEIMIQSVDTDGRKKGFDVELISQSVNLVNIPVIAASGAGTLDDILEVARTAKPDAIAIASLLHYDEVSIEDIKNHLRLNDIEVSR